MKVDMQKLEAQIQEARELAEDISERSNVNPVRACFQHAWAVRKVLGARIVAGSASWKFTDFDNGSNPMYVSYQFEQFQQEVESGEKEFDLFGNTLPEMHIWNIYQDKVLDITTPYFKDLVDILGFTWGTAPLPKYHFGPAEDHKVRWLYNMNPAATKLANSLVDRFPS